MNQERRIELTRAFLKEWREVTVHEACDFLDTLPCYEGEVFTQVDPPMIFYWDLRYTGERSHGKGAVVCYQKSDKARDLGSRYFLRHTKVRTSI